MSKVGNAEKGRSIKKGTEQNKVAKQNLSEAAWCREDMSRAKLSNAERK